MPTESSWGDEPRRDGVSYAMSGGIVGSLELFAKEWTGQHGGHTYRLRNSWTHGARLFVDDVCVAQTKRLIAASPGLPVMHHEFGDVSSLTRVDVFASAIATVQMKVVVDGVRVAGDDF